MPASLELPRAVTAPSGFPNRTRTSPSIPRRLLREGKLHLLPLYALMRTSDLAREGIESSGSYRFADHVYRGRPGGRHAVGRLLDRVLLDLRGARAMRSRFFHAWDQILAAARRHPSETPFRVLSVPCGIARELVEAAAVLRAERPGLYARTTFFGMDLDSRPLELSRELATGLTSLRLLRADAFDPAAYPPRLDVIVSNGFGDFLSDEELTRFASICHGALREGGVLVTSGMRRDRLADYFLRELAEIRARYREPGALMRILRRAGFHDITLRHDATGLESLLVARKETRT